MLCLRTDGDVALVAADTTGPLADLVDSDRSRGERLADRATRQAPKDPFQWTATPAMTTRSTLRLANPANLPGDARRDGGSTRRDAVADTPEHHDGSSRARLVDRSTTALRPHPVYLELCGPLAATRARRVGQQTGSIREPLLTTTDGTILDGHARWQVAIERAQPNAAHASNYDADRRRSPPGHHPTPPSIRGLERLWPDRAGLAFRAVLQRTLPSTAAGEEQ